MPRFEDCVMPFGDFVLTEYPDTSLVAGGILNQGSRLLLAGDSGIGKSYVEMQMLLQSALGVPWFGIWPVKAPLRSLYIQVEVAPAMLNLRAKRWAERGPMPPESMFSIALLRNYDIVENSGALKRYTEAEGIQLIGYDPFYEMHNGDENSVATVKPTLAAIDYALDEKRAAIITHHVNKPASLGGVPNMGWIRGSTALHNWADTVILAAGKTESGFKLYVLKARNREEALPKPLELTWQKPGAFFIAKELDSDGGRGDVYREVLGVGEMTKSALVSVLVAKGVPRRTAYRQIERGLREGLLVAEGEMLGLGI